jgi:hypothetical protein
MDDDENDLFAIDVSSDESSPVTKLPPRDYQSEADFLVVKAKYQPKVDDGEVGRATVSSSVRAENTD